VASHTLGADFKQLLVGDHFVEIGWFGFVPGPNRYNGATYLEPEGGEWTLSVYSHVSFTNGGKHIRIGKMEGKLKNRLNRWGYYICGVLNNDMIAKNQQFAGGTPPWEALGWLEYLQPYGGRGLLFARRGPDAAKLPPLELDLEKRALAAREADLIVRHQPPLNNDRYGLAGKKLKEARIAQHGPPTRVLRRNRACPPP